jgi:hypothetical protein
MGGWHGRSSISRIWFHVSIVPQNPGGRIIYSDILEISGAGMAVDVIFRTKSRIVEETKTT